MVKEAYEKLRKKHSLPSYESVNNEIEISEIESDDFLLRKIRQKILDKTDSTAEYIGSLLQPSAESIKDMHECRFFDDKDKKKLIDIYKRIMILDRGAAEAELEADDNADAKLISDFFKEWAGIKKELLPFFRKMKSCWEEETEIEEKLEYFG